MKNPRILVAIVALQAMTLLAVWGGRPALESTASAQIPDPGAQTQQVIDQLKTLNGKMDRLIGLLESGKLQVRAVSPDDKKAAP